MFFAGRIETNKYQKYTCNKGALITSGLDMSFVTIAQRYSTTEHNYGTNNFCIPS